MKLRLAGLASEGSGAVNEDAAGYLGEHDDVHAAWVLDGVTGINDRSLGLMGSDAQWLVSRIDTHLRRLFAQERASADILSDLIDAVIEDQRQAAGADLPADFDPPAACIMAVHRVGSDWHALRLGDCRLLAKSRDGKTTRMVDFPNDEFDRSLTEEATRLRSNGVTALPDIASRFQAQMFASRRTRNRAGGYGVIEADRACLAFAEYEKLAGPEGVLIASDGFYRIADCYRAIGDEALLAESLGSGGIAGLLARMRDIEKSDPDCQTYPRFKPADDASAVALMP
jgi:hypothetical protein